MEEVGAQVGVAAPVYIHHPFPALAGKRNLSPTLHRHHPQNSAAGWNPNQWDWDPFLFVARPIHTQIPPHQTTKQGHEDDHRLQLNLSGGLHSMEDPASRSNKRVRYGSPGGANYPTCQVDNCKEDLSDAKDYHRRHKVCELHSKAAKALVANQLQRFCQQCSRFHTLSEFDEGKRSCRRRLAGHNRRRRKTQADDVNAQISLSGAQDEPRAAKFDILNLLTALARAQGKNDDRSSDYPAVSGKDQLIQILNKINSLPLPMDLASQLSSLGYLENLERLFPDHQNQSNESYPSTMNLLSALSETLATSSLDALTLLSQRSTQSRNSGKSKSTCHDSAGASGLNKRVPVECAAVGGERNCSNHQLPIEDLECSIQETQASLSLQLFSSSAEDNSPPKLPSARKYFSSDSSNPVEDISPSSSPVVQKLFPVQSPREAVNYDKMCFGRGVIANAEVSRACSSVVPLDLFGGKNKGVDHGSYEAFHYQAGCTSSGSDHSRPSLNSNVQDRTGRIIFKLFDKDPSHLPGTLRAQIYNWLSNSPSEMESYIRPGCVVLSVYVSMSPTAWEQLEGYLLQRVSCLLQDLEADFWRKARFLIYTGRRLASHKDGRIRLCKSGLACNSPELTSVHPLAIESGKDVSFLLRGRNLTKPGTKIHCAYMGGYSSVEVTCSAYQETMCDEVTVGGFKIQAKSQNVFGRCFIEVENGFRGSSFPVIIADGPICKELRLLESEFKFESKACDSVSAHSQEYRRARSKEEVLHFINELGWLFQERNTSYLSGCSYYSLCRFKFLLVFSIDRDYCTLVKVILDMLVERNLDINGLSRKTMEMLSDIQLLSRAVKRRCYKMVEMLLNYYVIGDDYISNTYIFPPDLKGPGGITPLHLAACTEGSDDMVDLLTNDPQEIGVSCWTSLRDADGQSPYVHAMMRNNHSYNKLVACKIADRMNGQVSLTIKMAIKTSRLTSDELQSTVVKSRQGCLSCEKCAIVATKCNRRFPGSPGLLQRPYFHSMLAIAAVCACVCLFLRGCPNVGLVAPFKWENLDYGTI